MKVSLKILWIALIILSLGGLFYIWFIGLPIPKYKAVTDDKGSITYTVQVAPFTFFDIDMSEDEVVAKTDYETFYKFKSGFIQQDFNQIKANIVDAVLEVYGRPDGTLYRKFGDVTLTVNSELSMSQAYKSLTHNDTYRVEGYFQDVNLEKEAPIPTARRSTVYKEITKGVYGLKDNKYEYTSKDLGVLWCGQDNRFYKVQRVHGSPYETIQELLAMSKACYKVTFDKYWMGDGYYIFEKYGFCIGIKSLNLNTQLIAMTNSATQLDALLYTMEGSGLLDTEE